ncbi:MAG: uracil-DNA glycosylase [Candidatus Zambryskibacteria bacterium]|nr:uracil-DNA glycosylase [Candidatus Zambryskibacteria bacterium]
MRKIKDEVVALKKSPLYGYRRESGNLPVIGEGNHSAKIMFIGEAPGRNEAKYGRPFCGAAGKILDQLLESIGIDRKEVYVTNIVKDRPPQNRDPNPEEIKIYGPFLDRQIKIIQPKIIVTLGRYAMNYIMPKFGLEFEVEPISVNHGKVFTVPSQALVEWGWKDHEIKVIPLYHPAVAVYNSHTLDQLKKDFEVLKNI